MKLKDLTIVTLTSACLAFAAPPAASDHVSGRLLAQPRLGANSADVATALTKAGARLEKIIDRINVHVLKVPEPALDQVSAALMKTGMFTFVEPDHLLRSSSVVPNDPIFPSQWHLSAIHAPEAWGVTQGSSGVVIAVIDSGADWNHPDLASKLVPGWNFVTGTSNTQDSGGDSGHGTAVSGSAAAATSNGVGVSGVGWATMIMPLEVMDSSGSSSYSNLVSAINYAADHGARLINVSLCGSSNSSALQSAIDYAWNKGTVVFAAAGNGASSALTYPAAANNVVAVSATDANGTFASFSNYGSWIDISAPGNYIYTTMNGSSYGAWAGTSFSSPIAAGVAALVLSLKPGMSSAALVNLLEQNSDDLGAPGFDQYFGYGQVNAYKAVLAVGPATSDTTPPSVSIGSPASGATVAGNIQIQGTATDNAGVTTIQLYVDNQVVTTASSSPYSFAWNTGNFANGSHALKVVATDAAGNAGSATISVTVNNQAVVDVTPPTVTIVSPISGTSVTTVGANAQISASATDNVAVSQVSFYIDNVLKCTDTSAPYTCAWNTKKASSGAHTIKVTAWDRSNNSTSASETVYK